MVSNWAVRQGGTFGGALPEAPQDPVSGAVEEETELVGGGGRAGGAIRGEVGFVGLDEVFRLTAGAVEFFVKPTRLAAAQVGDDVTDVGSLRAGLDAGDDTAGAFPGLCAAAELLEAPQLEAGREIGIGGADLGETLMRLGHQALGMLVEGGGAGQADEIIDAVGVAPIHDLGTGIVAVATEQNGDPGPSLPDAADQPLHQGQDFLAAGPLGRTQHRGDQAPGNIEDVDGLEAVFVVVGVEQAQLLATMDGIEGVVDVEHDAIGHLAEGIAVKIDHGGAHPIKRRLRGQVLQP